METLNANRLMLAKGKKLDIVCQAELIDCFREIRKDISKLTYAIYCAELINNFGLENDTNSSQIYDILFESLKNLALSDSNEETLWTMVRFNLKLMSSLGYAVELNSCVRCNSNVKGNSFYFSAESGGIVCPDCKNSAHKVFDLDPNSLRILKDAINFDFPDSSEYNMKENNGRVINQLILGYCFNLLREYTSLRSHRKLKSPELIECLC